MTGRIQSARLAAALVLAIGARATASGPDLFGFGTRAPALAGTGAADADGAEAVYENPAGLVEPTRRRLSLGFLAARYRLRMDGAPHDVEDTNGAYLGAAVPLPFGGVLAERLAIGLGFYFPTNVLNRALAAYPDEPRLALLDSRSQVVSAMAGLGARLHRRVTVGVGVLVLATLVGEVRVAPDNGGRITTLAEEQILVSYAPLVGARVQVTPSLRIGAVFRGESAARYDIAIVTDLGTAIPVMLPVLHVKGTAQYDPLQAALEAAWRPRPWLDLILGATWKHWSPFGLPIENATDSTPAQPPPNFHDTVVPRIAGEASRVFSTGRGPVTLRARAGYFFEWSPAPRDAPVLLDADRHVFTLGGALQWDHRFGALVLDLFGQWHQLAGSTRATGSLFVLGGGLGVDL